MVLRHNHLGICISFLFQTVNHFLCISRIGKACHDNVVVAPMFLGGNCFWGSLLSFLFYGPVIFFAETFFSIRASTFSVFMVTGFKVLTLFFNCFFSFFC